MSILIFWCIWSLVSSIGIKYVSMRLLNVDLELKTAFYILLAYQWIRFVKPINSKDLDKVNTKTKPATHKSLSDFNSIINNNFKKRK